MNTICDKRCIIGEGPIWNEKEQKLYFTNGMGNEICMLDIYSGKLEVRPLDFGCAAFCFSKNNELIVSTDDGVFILNGDNTTSPIYHTDKFDIKYCNDMKVGPDGRIYVGTQSSKRKGVSDKTDGKLYSIDKNGNVCVLLDNLILSNGLEWSMRTVSLSKLFIVKFAEPLFACIFGAVLLGENIFKIQYLLAFVLISTGIIMGNKDQ